MTGQADNGPSEIAASSAPRTLHVQRVGFVLNDMAGLDQRGDGAHNAAGNVIDEVLSILSLYGFVGVLYEPREVLQEGQGAGGQDSDRDYGDPCETCPQAGCAGVKCPNALVAE